MTQPPRPSPTVAIIDDGESLASLARSIPATLDRLDQVPPDGWDAEVVWLVEAAPPAWEAALLQAPSLRWVHWAGTGVDHAGLPLRRPGVVVTTSAGTMAHAVAEYAVLLALAWCRDLVGTLDDHRQRRWRRREATSLAELTTTILGAGSIGRQIARIVTTLGGSPRLVGRTERADGEFGQVHGVDELTRLAATTDLLVVAAPLTASTRGVVDAEVLDAMPTGGYLVNVGRGELVDAAALAAALASGRLAGAAVDVFDREPLPPDDPRWSTPGLLVSPHIAAATGLVGQRLRACFLDNLARYRAGEPLANRVTGQDDDLPERSTP